MTKRSNPDQATLALVQPEPNTTETENPTSDVVATESAPLANVLKLPPLEAPAVNPSEPSVSYKVDFSDRTVWWASDDGGKTKRASESAYIAGAPCDLCLQVSPAQYREGFDQRFRLAFHDAQGVLSELNLNATNVARDGSVYVSSPVRSLVGALLAISDSEEDMHAFCAGARFHILPGRGKGVFVECDIASDGTWIGMGSPAATNAIAKDPDGLHLQLALIKARFRACGLLLTSSAVLGMPVTSGGSEAVTTTAVAVED